jgi:hypothetical protein
MKLFAHKKKEKKKKGTQVSAPSLLWGIECLDAQNAEVGLEFIRACISWLRDNEGTAHQKRQLNSCQHTKLKVFSERLETKFGSPYCKNRPEMEVLLLL